MSVCLTKPRQSFDTQIVVNLATRQRVDLNSSGANFATMSRIEDVILGHETDDDKVSVYSLAWVCIECGSIGEAHARNRDALVANFDFTCGCAGESTFVITTRD